MLKQKRPEQNIKSRSHGSAVLSKEVFLDIYLILREKKESRGREAEVERTEALCASLGESDAKTRQSSD